MVDSTPRPSKCECGWILPAAFQFIAPNWSGRLSDPPLAKGTTLLFACGNCGCWCSIAISTRGGARTANADGFVNMPSHEKCAS
jgi:hypothetical protein